MRRRRKEERGAALLSVLLLVAVMAVIAATSLDRLTLAARISGGVSAMDQGRALVYAAEQIALGHVQQWAAGSPRKLSADAGWLGRDFALPLPQGQAMARVADGSACLNLNGLVSETAPGLYSQRPVMVQQLAALLGLLGVEAGEAQAIAAATGDWLDSDSIAMPLGAEDAAYMGREQPYLPANRMMVDVSEWRAVRGVTDEIYGRVQPWLCALPLAEPVVMNVNLLRPDQALLVAALMGDAAHVASVRGALAARPRGGYGSGAEFLQAAKVAGPLAAAQLGVTSRWLRLDVEVRSGDGILRSSTLIDAYGGEAEAGLARPILVRRAWGEWD